MQVAKTEDALGGDRLGLSGVTLTLAQQCFLVFCVSFTQIHLLDSVLTCVCVCVCVSE